MQVNTEIHQTLKNLLLRKEQRQFTGQQHDSPIKNTEVAVKIHQFHLTLAENKS